MIIDENIGFSKNVVLAFQHVLRALKGRLTLVENIQASIVAVTDTGAANSAFTVQHNLGRVPVAYFWNVDRSATIYDSAKATWTTTTMTLKCSVASASATMVVF